MLENTLAGLLKFGNSPFAKEDAKFMIVKVVNGDNDPEIIINTRSNFESKLDYYQKAYTEELVLKNNPDIRITEYYFVEDLDDLTFLISDEFELDELI